MPADIPPTMAAVLLRGHGGIEMLEYREDVPVPVAGAGEVLSRVGGAGGNNTATFTLTPLVQRCPCPTCMLPPTSTALARLGSDT